MINQHVDDIVNSLTINSAITELGVFYRCILREDRRLGYNSKVSSDEIRERLQHLISQGRIMALIPAGINPETAARAERYYIKVS